MNNFYMNGNKFNYDIEEDGYMGEPVMDTSITVIDGVEYPVLVGHPQPFVYGVKTICTKVYGDKCDTYDVKTGEYFKGVDFKGFDWLYSIYTSPTTLDMSLIRPAPPEEAFGETVILSKVD